MTTLTWLPTSIAMDNTRGGECHEAQCEQFPRVLRLVQRPHRDADWVETYSVVGIEAQYYPTADAALAAMRSNP